LGVGCGCEALSYIIKDLISTISCGSQEKKTHSKNLPSITSFLEFKNPGYANILF